MRGLQVGGAADDLAGIAGRAFEQHIDGVANHRPVEGRLLAVDQFLKPHQSFVHLSRGPLEFLQVRRRRARPGRVLERIGASVSDLRDKREGRGEFSLAFAGEAHNKIR